MNWSRRCLFPTLILVLTAAPIVAEDDAGFASLFDGTSLAGWDGNPQFWRVEDGAITGQTTADNPTKGNTFIIYRGGEVGDFELKLQYKIVGGNSGIQYRSFEVPDQKWVVGGYQADFEAGQRYSGICYGERFRGILADRGQKTVIGNDHKPKVVGAVGDSDELQKHIKSEDWNDYHIIAKGFNLVHKINGHVTCEVTDEDQEQRRATGILALQLHAGPPMKVQFRDIRLKRLGAKKEADQAAANAESAPANKPAAKKKVLFLAGGRSHGYGAHDHLAGCTLLATSLDNSGLPIQSDVHYPEWPNDPSLFDGVDCVVMYGDGGGRHMVNAHLAEMDALAKKGVGIVCIHYAVEVPKGPSGEKFLDWIGGYFEPHWSVNPHWTAKFEKFPEHPITRGVRPFEINDEWYYHMRFRDGMSGVTPILTDLPPKETLTRPDGPHSGNPHVRAAIAKDEVQHVAWAAERPDQGRGFGFTGGHVHWNWSDPNFRKLVLNAIVWCARLEVPAGGVQDAPKTLADLEEKHDETPPANFDREAIRKKFNLPADQEGASTGETKNAKKKGAQAKRAERNAAAASPVFESPLVTSKTPQHSVNVDVNVEGAKQLFLIVTDGGNGFGCDWADWAEPRLVGPSGEKRLTELKWKSATTDWGQVRLNQNAGGGPLQIAGKKVEYGIGTHANSVIAFDLPPGYTRFQARAGLDNGGTNQNDGQATSVQFFVFTDEPSRSFLSKLYSAPGAAPVSHDAADAVAQLEVHPDLEVALFAAEPHLFNPTNIDIDHLGRVWVCEVLNYRRFANKQMPERQEGDRILVVEDSDGNGQGDRFSVFYQGRDIDSAHGICVLGTPSGKGTRVLVSALDSVFFLIDDNGDLKADRKELLFTGISGSQHDHGIHAFVFGPDGKLYFNFGNEGKQILDRHGKPVVDMAGNTVNDQRKPYQQGMVFRCNLDGSEFETLGWNFRNNWEVAVDSFGTLWQSDNDDDGNRGTRINYVMEFGNYGYKDELTGAGWQAERTNIEDEIPLRHWHLNDPGVIPNLLQTGAGSPTGICVYEGKQLPELFQGEVIHCDAGPSITRAYPAQPHGAGYEAEVVNILDGSANRWFRPSDVCVAPDGSMLVSDWYDPGVGGHRMGDIEHGRLFRVTVPGQESAFKVPACDFASVEGCIRALHSPNLATRYIAWTTLQEHGAKSEGALEKLYRESNEPWMRARALWLLGKIPGRAAQYVALAGGDQDENIRIVAIRLARQTKQGLMPLLEKLAADQSPRVRREVAIALRHRQEPQAAELWAELAAQHDGQDRWYLEALGIGADRQWDAFLAAWQKKVGGKWNTPAGRDIVWRSRSKQTPALLAKIILDPNTPLETQPRYFRAFDFLSGSEKDAALKSILGQ